MYTVNTLPLCLKAEYIMTKLPVSLGLWWVLFFAASARSTTIDPRNKNLPFKLQPLPRALAAELPQLSKELLHDEFDGLLLTVHSKALKPGGLGNSPVSLSSALRTPQFVTCM